CRSARCLPRRGCACRSGSCHSSLHLGLLGWGPGWDDFYAQLTAGLERKARVVGVLSHRRPHRAARADVQLARADDARTLALEELAVDRDVAGTDDLAIREHARRTDHELGLLAEVDRAVLEQAVDLDLRARVELQGRVAQHVAAPEVATARLATGRRGGRYRARHQHGRDHAVLDALRAVASGREIQPRHVDDA